MPDTQVNTLFGGQTFNGGVVALNDGGYVAVWSQLDQGSSDYNVYSQRYDAAGVKVSGQTLVNTQAAGDQTLPAVTSLDNGGYAVLFRSATPEAPLETPKDFYVRLFGADGAAIGPEFQATAGDAYAASIAAHGANGVILAWEGFDNASQYTRAFDGTGVATGPRIEVSSMARADHSTAVAALEDGGYVVVASAVAAPPAADGNHDGLAVTVFNVDGTVRKAEQQVNETDSLLAAVNHTAVQALEGGGFLVTWETPEPSSSTTIRARLYDAGGVAITNDTYIARNAMQPEILALPDGGYLVLYTALDVDEAYNILAYRYDAAGTRLGERFLISEAGPGEQAPQGAVLADGSVVVTWQEDTTAIQQTRFHMIDGGAGDDTLAAVPGRNFMFGFGGDDVLISGSEGDMLDGGAGVDTASYVNTQAGVDISIQFRAERHADGATGPELLTDIENLIGSAYADTLTGNRDANRLEGGDGDDILYGREGNDELIGGAGDDMLYGGSGIDQFDGGAGIDTVSFADWSGSITADLQLGAANPASRAFTGVENVIGGAYIDTLIGDAAANILTGGDGSDKLTGAGGDDTLIGGAGTDIAQYAAASGAVTVSLAISGPQDTGAAGVDTLIEMESLLGGAYADTLTGDDGDNGLYGGGGDDLLVGGGGDDTISGGAGVDTVSYASAPGGVTIRLSASNGPTGSIGSDWVTDVENVTGSAFGDTLTGDAANNVLLGMDGDDVLDGGVGADTLDGGIGGDTASYATATAGVRVTLSAMRSTGVGAAVTDTLVAIEHLTGSAFADTLIGDDGANLLTGSAGADLLFGEGGDDNLLGGDGADILNGGLGWNALNGGAGIDTADYGDIASVPGGGVAGVTVNLSLAGAQDIGAGRTDALTGIENLRGGGLDDVLTGDSGANGLAGGDGDDVLQGAGGDDLLDGGNGSDTASYDGAVAGVTVSLSLSGAQNTVGAGQDTLVAIENLTGSAFADTLRGDAGHNRLSGGDGADSLDGGAGDDTLSGGGGADNIVGGDGLDAIDAGADDDLIAGGAGADVIRGGAGSDLLYGQGGDDVLYDGGETDNRDFLYGGAGNDTYYVDSSLTGPLDLVFEGGDNPDLMAGAGDADIIYSGGSFFWDYYGVAEALHITNGLGSQLVGGTGGQSFFGSGGSDQIIAYGGSNRVDAGEGTDAISFGLYGLAESFDGANTLVMKAGNGLDYVYEFESGVDKIDLTAFNFGITGQQVLDQAVNVDQAGTANDYCYFYLTSAGGVDNYVAFIGLLSSQLQASDFITA